MVADWCVADDATRGTRWRLLVLGRVDGETSLSHVFVRLEDNDINLGREETEQSYGGTQADGHAQRRYLDLNTRKISL